MNLNDLSKTPHDDVLDILQARLGVDIDRDAAHYSVLNGTAGFPTSAGTWARLAWHRPGHAKATTITGLQDALTLNGVPRPIWKAGASWHDDARQVVWQADEMTRAPDPVVSATATATFDPDMPAAWWTQLRTACQTLAEHQTARICMTQAHLSRRIADAYGEQIDTTITDWATVHGDLGWANLCGPTLTILDWEDWGTGPAALDAACLWAASLQVPPLAAKVTAAFEDVLSTRTGQLTQLMLCANVARAYRRTGRKGPLTDAMAAIASKLLVERG